MRDVCVAILSDFGTRDAYAGVMKAVVAGLAPRARLIDLTHEIPPGDVRLAAFRLWQVLPHVPPGTVFLAVVDPGVGTARRPIAARWNGFSFVGPDNGIFTYLLEGKAFVKAVEVSVAGLPDRSPPSSTFHGRDIFAPAAGLLASGTRLEKLGPEAGNLVRIPWPSLSRSPQTGLIQGEVVCVDGFGNGVTSIGVLRRTETGMRLEPWMPGPMPADLPASRLRAGLPGGGEAPVCRTFGEVAPGEALAYIGSDGLLEIGVNQGNAAQVLGLKPGSPVSLFS